MKLLTQRGYDLYEVASALQKSIRRADVKLAGYMALELFPKYAGYAWRRLLTVSAEDCHGLVTQEIKALYDSFQVINKGKKTVDLKGRIFISKAVIILCTCGHSRDADVLSNYIYDKKSLISDDEIERLFDEIRQNPKVEMPEYVFDVHTMRGKREGKTKQQFFREEEAALANKQISLFDIEF
jgi:replication-associated recombination protein RarA